MKNSIIKTIVFVFVFLFALQTSRAVAEDYIKVTTWNIEHLGTEGRGFGGGYGGGDLPLRTDPQLKKIGKFIRDELKSDVVALQEIAITYLEDHVTYYESRSKELDVITNEMGDNWKYYLPPKHQNHHGSSMYVGFIWNSDTIKALKLRPLYVQNLDLAGKSLFDRTPALGYFEIKDPDQEKNDFLLVNIHLASGQYNDENHLIAMTLIQYKLNKALQAIKVKESDRIILGDFNDNPYAETSAGNPKYSDALYHHMSNKGYTDFVTPDFHSTRMDSNLKSIIDHILVNKSAKYDVKQSAKAEIWLPDNHPSSFSLWRQTYSDHFPISIDLKIKNENDADWEN